MAPALALRTTRAWRVKTTARAAAAAKALAPEARKSSGRELSKNLGSDAFFNVDAWLLFMLAAVPLSNLLLLVIVFFLSYCWLVGGFKHEFNFP